VIDVIRNLRVSVDEFRAERLDQIPLRRGDIGPSGASAMAASIESLRGSTIPINGVRRVLRRESRVGSPLLGGLALFVLAASAGLAVLVLQNREPRALMTLGASLLVAGVGVAMWSLPHHAIAVFFAGTSLAGMGFGAGFQGAVRSIVLFAAPHERAGVLSIVFIVSYLSMGVPAIAAGALVARHGNILGTGEVFGVVMALALVAVLAAGLRTLTASRNPTAR
jgi:hypothetical protein